jgi:hypothetical protein
MLVAELEGQHFTWRSHSPSMQLARGARGAGVDVPELKLSIVELSRVRRRPT